MKSSAFPLLLLCLTLTACGTTRPLQYPDVIPPQTAAFEPLRSDAPVVALVLGSGGRRGFAHVGVIKALETNGVPVDIVVGTSVGSLVGALYAGGYNSGELERIALDLDRARLDDFDLSMRGYIRGEQLQDFVNKALENRSIEQLDKPFAAVATRLGDGETIAFNHGNTGMAVRASSSIPGMFYPVTIDASEYVDGDLKKPVPISIAREMGADLVIAVDISQQPVDYPPPRNVIDMLSQSIRILRQTILAHELKDAQIVIRPAIGQTPEIDAVSKQRLMQNGEDAAMAALPSIREWLEQIARKKSSAPAERPETR